MGLRYLDPPAKGRLRFIDPPHAPVSPASPLSDAALSQPIGLGVRPPPSPERVFAPQAPQPYQKPNELIPVGTQEIISRQVKEHGKDFSKWPDAAKNYFAHLVSSYQGQRPELRSDPRTTLTGSVKDFAVEHAPEVLGEEKRPDQKVEEGVRFLTDSQAAKLGIIPGDPEKLSNEGGRYYRLGKSAAQLEDQAAREQNAKRIVGDAGPVMRTAEAFSNRLSDFPAALARPVMPAEISDEINRNKDAIAGELADRAGNFERHVQGAAGSIGSMVGSMPAAVVAPGVSPYILAGSTGLSELNHAITVGRDQGLKGSDLAKYAIGRGGAEAIPSMVFSAMGMPGAEAALTKMVGKPMVDATRKQIAAEIGLRTAVAVGAGGLQEVPEETITTVLQYALDKSYDVPTQELPSAIADTVIQALMAGGVANAPRGLLSPIQTQPDVVPVPPPKAPIGPSESTDTVSESEAGQADVVSAEPEQPPTGQQVAPEPEPAKAPAELPTKPSIIYKDREGNQVQGTVERTTDSGEFVISRTLEDGTNRQELVKPEQVVAQGEVSEQQPPKPKKRIGTKKPKAEDKAALPPAEDATLISPDGQPFQLPSGESQTKPEPIPPKPEKTPTDIGATVEYHGADPLGIGGIKDVPPWKDSPTPKKKLGKKVQGTPTVQETVASGPQPEPMSETLAVGIRANSTPQNDIHGKPTGWLVNVNSQSGAMLVHPTDNTIIRFDVQNPKSGTELQRRRAEAQAYAIDNPIVPPKVEPSGELVVKPIYEAQASPQTPEAPVPQVEQAAVSPEAVKDNKTVTDTVSENGPTPSVAPGMVRLYHGGVAPDGGARWVTPDPKYAEGYATKDGRTDGAVYYVDVPATSPHLTKAFNDEGTNVVAPYSAFEAPSEIAKDLKPYRPAPQASKPAGKRKPIGKKAKKADGKTYMTIPQAKRLAPTKVNQTLSKEMRKEGDEKEGFSAADVIKTWERIFGLPIRSGQFRANSQGERGAIQGFYNWLTGVARMTEPNAVNLAVAAHEIAHHLDNVIGITNKKNGRPGKKIQGAPKGVDLEISEFDYDKGKKRVYEGWAEFLRNYLTEDNLEALRTLAPKFLEWFEGDWAKAHPQEYAKIQEAREYALKYADQSIVQRARSAIGRAGEDLDFAQRLKDRLESTWTANVTKWEDRHAMVQFLEDEAVKRGADLTGSIGPAEGIRAYDMTARPNANRAIEMGVHRLTDGKVIGPKLIPETPFENSEEYDEWATYAWAQHTLFMADKKPGYATGFPGGIEGAEAAVADIDPEKKKKFDPIRKQYSSFMHALNEMRVNAGDMTANEAQHVKDFYGDNFFSLRRIPDHQMQGYIGGGGKIFNLSRSVKARTQQGSGRNIQDPWDSMVDATVEAYGRAALARVNLALLKIAVPEYGGVRGMGFLVEKVDPKIAVTEGTVEEILRQLVDAGWVDEDNARGARIARKLDEGKELKKDDFEFFAERHGLSPEADYRELQIAAKEELDLDAVIALYRQDYTPNAEKATVRTVDPKGDPVMLRLDRWLHDATSMQDPASLGAWLGVFQGFARGLKTGAVGLSTQFGFKNLLIDTQDAMTTQRETKNQLETVAKAAEFAGKTISYRVQEYLGMAPEDAAIALADQMGGNLFNRLGADVAARKFYRKKRIGKSEIESHQRLRSLGDKVQSVVNGMQDMIAATDMVNRLPEGVAAARRLGYTYKGKQWFDRDGKPVERLPEHVRVRFINAMANATTNFKIAGTYGRQLNTVSPFFNAAIQGTARDIRQLRSIAIALKSGNASTETQKQAKALVQKWAMRLAVNSMLAFAGGLAWAKFRSDDDDYEETSDQERDRWWTLGDGLVTTKWFPKGRSIPASLNNMGESLGKAIYGKSKQSPAGAVIDSVVRDVRERLPSPGAGLVQAGYQLMQNEDYAGRPIEQKVDVFKDTPKELRTNENSTSLDSMLSSGLGKVLGDANPLSPAQINHLVNSASGGLYNRMANATSAAFNGTWKRENDPVYGRLLANRWQIQSISNFYEEADAVKRKAQLAEARGETTGEAFDQKAKFDDYEELMTEIRKMDTRGLDGRRSRKYEHYLVGLSREALGLEPLESAPSPFYEDAPDEVKKVIKDFARRKADVAIGEARKPEKVHKGDKSFEETMSKWKAGRDSDKKWLSEHKDSPVVKSAVEEVRAEEFAKYRKTLGSKR